MPNILELAVDELPWDIYLDPLVMSSSAAQCNANYIIQMLRPFPQLMVQEASFPPFIHPFSYDRPTVSQASVIQEPLANCMSIAQMFVPRTEENIPFVWKTIHTEQRRLLNQMATFSKEDLLAAIQAYIIYLIMRIADDSLRHSKHDLHMLLSFQPFALEEQTNPSHTWQDWVFSESRRRVACLWFVIGRVICVKTGIPCDTSEVYRDLPLPSGHSLWTAKSHEEWETDYRASQMDHTRPRLAYFGELIEAQKKSGDGLNARKLDLWHMTSDQLGIMLMLETALV